MSYNSFYVFAPQIATASQPVISLFANASHPKSGTATKEKDLFFCFLHTPPFGQASVKPAAARRLRQLFIGAIFQCPKPLWMLIF